MPKYLKRNKGKNEKYREIKRGKYVSRKMYKENYDKN